MVGSLPSDDYSVDDFLPGVASSFTVDGTLQSMSFDDSDAVGYDDRTVFEEPDCDPNSQSRNPSRTRSRSPSGKRFSVWP